MSLVRLRVPSSFGRCKEKRHRQKTWSNARAELESESDSPAHLAQQLQVSFSFTLILFLVAAVLLLLPCYILAHRYYSFAFFLSVCVVTVTGFQLMWHGNTSGGGYLLFSLASAIVNRREEN